MPHPANLLFLGARGSIPISGPDFVRYGGNTTCLALSVESTLVGVIDAGTGLVRLEDHGFDVPPSLPILLTHYHWDHIQGLSMLPELWNGGHVFTFFGPGDPEEVLTGAIRPPWFPVELRRSACTIIYHTIDEPMDLGGILVTAFPVNHPQGALGFRLDGPLRSVALVTDHESSPESDDIIAAAVHGVDVLVHDAQYLPEEFDDRRGWGHSTWEQAVAMAERVGADRLILTSHGTDRTDDAMDGIVAAASTRFGSTQAAREGLNIEL
jgi:phosphoribosyl 1,2-cyclic phosphodiesterase